MNSIKIAVCFLCLLGSVWLPAQKELNQSKNIDEVKIQVALLIDVSGSMDQLIAQAQGQLWKMANFLSQLKKDGQTPTLEIGLISFGGLEYEQHKAVKLESPLVTNLDFLAERLFNLQAMGSQEHCAEALQMAIDSLNWSEQEKDLKVIIIAGNEAFDQGPLDYRQVCSVLKEKNILVNTVYCGDFQAGITHLWKDAADLSQGIYANMQQNQSTDQMDTPYDVKIADLYRQYKNTLVPYGPDADQHHTRMNLSDNAIKKMGNIFYRDRILLLINNTSNFGFTDLIDLFGENGDQLPELKQNFLPSSYQEMSPANLRKKVIEFQYKRRVIKDAIQLYTEKVEDFLQISYGENYNENSLETIILQILKEQSKANGFL